MYVEQTSSGRFALQELTAEEMELLMNGLIEVKQHSLKDPEQFKTQRQSCNEMFLKIDLELRKSRS